MTVREIIVPLALGAVGGVLGMAAFALYDFVRMQFEYRRLVRRNAEDVEFLKNLPGKGTPGKHVSGRYVWVYSNGGDLVYDSVRGTHIQTYMKTQELTHEKHD